MRSRAETLLRWTAATAAALTLGALGLAAGGSPAAAWAMLGFMYLTAVSYGLGEMIRLFERHKRRCRECLEGAGPHLRWWIVRLALVLVVSGLPVLFLIPVASSFRG